MASGAISTWAICRTTESFFGNLILLEWEWRNPGQMIAKQGEVAKWNAADSTGAIDYYYSRYGGSPGTAKCIIHMLHQIDTVLSWANL
jgi:hypothetical protein